MTWLRDKGKDKVGICPSCLAPKLNYRPDKEQGVCNNCHKGWNKTSLERAGFDFHKDFTPLQLPEPLLEAPLPNLVPVRSHEFGRMALDIRRWGPGPWEETCFYCPDDARLYFRLTGKDPLNLLRMTSRSIWPNQRGWRLTGSRTGYWYGEIPPWYKPIVIMEGINDVIGPQLYGRAIAVLGTSLGKDMQSYLWGKGHREIVTWLDPDEAGKQGALKLKRELQGMFRVHNIEHPVHPKNVPAAEARELIRCALL